MASLLVTFRVHNRNNRPINYSIIIIIITNIIIVIITRFHHLLNNNSIPLHVRVSSGCWQGGDTFPYSSCDNYSDVCRNVCLWRKQVGNSCCAFTSTRRTTKRRRVGRMDRMDNRNENENKWLAVHHRVSRHRQADNKRGLAELTETDAGRNNDSSDCYELMMQSNQGVLWKFQRPQIRVKILVILFNG